MKILPWPIVFLGIAGAIVAFKLTEFAFWLMNQRSTMFNIVGLLLILLLIISVSILLTKIKKTK